MDLKRFLSWRSAVADVFINYLFFRVTLKDTTCFVSPFDLHHALRLTIQPRAKAFKRDVILSAGLHRISCHTSQPYLCRCHDHFNYPRSRSAIHMLQR